MAVRTTKAELEAEIERLNIRITEQSDKITELLKDAENEFLHSHTYQDLQDQLRAEKIASKFDKSAIERLEKENSALRDEIARLKAMTGASPASKNRGRKSKVSQEMCEDIRARHDAGWSIRDIADYLELTKSTVHRALHVQD